MLLGGVFLTEVGISGNRLAGFQTVQGIDEGVKKIPLAPGVLAEFEYGGFQLDKFLLFGVINFGWLDRRSNSIGSPPTLEKGW